MRFHDPLTELAIELEPGWSYDAGSSTLATARFCCWNGENIEASLVPPPAAPAIDDEAWAAAWVTGDVTWSLLDPPLGSGARRRVSQ